MSTREKHTRRTLNTIFQRCICRATSCSCPLSYSERFGFWIICRARCASNTKYKQPCSFSITKLNLSTAHTVTQSISFTQGQKQQPHTWKVILFGRSLILKPPSITCLCRFSHCLSRAASDEDETQDESAHMQLSKIRLFSWVKSSVICHPSRAAWQKYQGHLI